jgi:hypothetical protein
VDEDCLFEKELGRRRIGFEDFDVEGGLLSGDDVVDDEKGDGAEGSGGEPVEMGDS